MKKNYFILVLSFLFNSFLITAQGGVCTDLAPLVIEDSFVIIDNCFNGNNDCVESAEQGPDYGCLGSEPFPSWFSIEITTPGSLEFTISQNTEFDINGEPIGTTLDVDFIVWGPFAAGQNVCDYSNLSNNFIVDCSFEPVAAEIATLPTTFEAEVYVLMITNFNQQEGFFKIEQTAGTGQAGGNGIPQIIETCEGTTVTLDATDPDATAYQWQVFENGAFMNIASEISNTLSVNESGLYKAQITKVDTSIEEEEYIVDFLAAPEAFSPPALVVCDDDGDGVASFDLTSQDATIVNGQTGTTITYYLTQNDADTMSNPLMSPFDSSSQTIFARIDRTNTEECYGTTSFDLIVEDFLDVNLDTVDDLELEDTDGDGLETFDLTINDLIILNGQSAGDYVIAYFTTNADAQANINSIATPSSYTNITNPQTIWFNVQNVVSGCFGVGEFNLIVLPEPEDTDDDGVPDTEEDVNGNGNLDDDDTDDDGVPNYQDDDDDGDLVSTADETIGIGAGEQFDIIDTDDDGIQNYLDNDDDGDGILSANEDYNGNGNPIDDDTNNNDIPDFLDAEVALSIEEQILTNSKVYPNPTTNSIFINLPNSVTIVEAQLFDIQGKKVLGVRVLSEEGMIDMSNLKRGVYFLEISYAGKIETQKIIKR
jgi:hypothetical protein